MIEILKNHWFLTSLVEVLNAVVSVLFGFFGPYPPKHVTAQTAFGVVKEIVTEFDPFVAMVIFILINVVWFNLLSFMIKKGVGYKALIPKNKGWIAFKKRPATKEELRKDPFSSFVPDCRLPEDGERVLFLMVHDDMTYEKEGYFFASGFLGSDNLYRCIDSGLAIAWKPL